MGERKVTFTMTRSDALIWDLLVCECRHRTNNHFGNGKGACAHCNCVEYRERAAVGTLSAPSYDTKEPGCTCGSGAHPRRCALHPQAYDAHVAGLNASPSSDAAKEGA